MSSELGVDEAFEAIELARMAVASYVREGKRERPGCMDEVFYERTGVFIRLTSTRGRGKVRGSAGSFRREKQLSEAIVDAAIEASSGTTGRSEIEACELDAITVTLGLIDGIEQLEGPPESAVELGCHGLIVEGDEGSGWMLPTVPVEHGWSATEYLDRTCCKAGFNRGAWRDDDVTVYCFQGQIFEEDRPGGAIEEIELTPEATASH